MRELYSSVSQFVFFGQNQYIFENVLSIGISRNQNLMTLKSTNSFFNSSK